MDLYLVHYSTGEYDDYTTDVVVAYRTKGQAEQHAQKANDWLRSRNLHYGYERTNRQQANFTDNPYDPAPYRSVDYTGAEYHFDALPTPLLDRVPR